MQTVLITGAASGIGRDTARLFASAGWQCVLVDRNVQALEQVVQSLPVHGTAAHVPRVIDLTDRQQIEALAQGTPALDAILNNAGMTEPSTLPLIEQTPEQLQRLLALNLAAPAAVVEACAGLLRPGARIVNVSSGAGLAAIPWRGAYSPSKAGLIAQTQALAQARPDLCVTVLAPGFVRTELVENLIATGRLVPEGAVAKIPLGRMAAPMEMAQALFFLASDGAKPFSGQILALNGGSSIYGGSRPFAPTTIDTLPLDLPVKFEVRGDHAEPWRVRVEEPTGPVRYEACLDSSALYAPAGGLLQAVHAAATHFANRHVQQASLTVLLPSRSTVRWQDAGDAAAARMLLSTLACEWGALALRINAIEVPEGLDPQQLHPLLVYVGGSAAQYLTGQTLVCHAPSSVPTP
ncbi:SDR family NAD(P)-dependent oxidoreductase [Ottowia thiooxydans]|uniref:SDR family NAD(P)-dependent oxidoreductase n=1 Tax=Ottowia thiooxydans TaxID=219182 RepID=UPI00041CF55F|nr:SDR family oxidoreductase [Ottowia thiooxydans]